jgi:hypothetical protein
MKYLRKPISVDAFQWKGKPDENTPEWFFEAVKYNEISTVRSNEERLYILETTQEVYPNDYLIKDVDNEIYSCKPDLFDVLYVPIQDGGNIEVKD